MAKRSSSGAWLETIAQSTNNQFLVPSVATNESSQVTLTIPLNTIPSEILSNGEYYDIQVELWTANWGTKLGTSTSNKLNIIYQ